MRIIALFDGGDWNDASVDHLEVPDDMDLSEMQEEYDNRYEKRDKEGKYTSFQDFLLLKGAILTDKVEEYWPYF